MQRVPPATPLPLFAFPASYTSSTSFTLFRGLLDNVLTYQDPQDVPNRARFDRRRQRRDTSESPRCHSPLLLSSCASMSPTAVPHCTHMDVHNVYPNGTVGLLFLQLGFLDWEAGGGQWRCRTARRRSISVAVTRYSLRSQLTSSPSPSTYPSATRSQRDQSLVPYPLQQTRLRQVTHHQSSLTACGGRVSLTPRLSSYSFKLPAQQSAPMVSEHLSLPCTPGPRGAVKAVPAQRCVSRSRPKAVLLPRLAFVVPIPKLRVCSATSFPDTDPYARHVLNQRGATHPCRRRNRQATRSRPLPVWEYRAATDFNRWHSDKCLL